MPQSQKCKRVLSFYSLRPHYSYIGSVVYSVGTVLRLDPMVTLITYEEAPAGLFMAENFCLLKFLKLPAIAVELDAMQAWDAVVEKIADSRA